VLREVVQGWWTVEKDVNVLRLAAYNPWSRDLFKEPIEIVVEGRIPISPKM
jgi:predicted methyltransferase